jgi:hypothetical protein
LRIPYKPFTYRNRGVPDQGIIWRPVLNVKIIYNHAQSKRFEAIVDSGSDYCLFHASIGAALGIKVTTGAEGDLGGVITGVRTKVYYHNVKLVVGADMVEIKAGFSWDLTDNLLGQIGFFEHFSVAFDPSSHPPFFELHRVHRH